MPPDDPKITGRFEVEVIRKRLASVDLEVRDLRATVDREKTHVSEALSGIMDAAKRYADTLVLPIRGDVAKALKILELQENREKAKMEFETESIAAKKANEEEFARRMKERSDWLSSADKHKDARVKRLTSWIVPLLAAIISGAGTLIVSHLLK
jgi:hypothetical protein